MSSEVEPIAAASRLGNGAKRISPALPEWVPRAWEMRIAGMQTWESIGSAVGHKWDTVKKWVTLYSQMLGEVADKEDVIHARAEYISGLQRVKRHAMQIMLGSDHAVAQIGALNTFLKACEKLAAAKGVPTEYSRTELTGAVGIGLVRVPVFSEDDPLCGVDGQDSETIEGTERLGLNDEPREE